MPDKEQPAIVTAAANGISVANTIQSFELVRSKQITGLRLRRLDRNDSGLLSVRHVNSYRADGAITGVDAIQIPVVLEVRVSMEFEKWEGGKPVAGGVRDVWTEVPVVDDESEEGFAL